MEAQLQTDRDFGKQQIFNVYSSAYEKSETDCWVYHKKLVFLLIDLFSAKHHDCCLATMGWLDKNQYICQ